MIIIDAFDQIQTSNRNPHSFIENPIILLKTCGNTEAACQSFVLNLFSLFSFLRYHHDPDLCDEECSTEEELCIANIFHSMDLLSNI